MRITDGNEYDIIVCGSGSAGFCAAVQAAREGCRVAVLERYSMPGGIMTVMGNNAVAQFHAYKKQVIHGIGWEYLLELERRGYARIPDMTVDAPHWKYGVDVNPVAAAQLIDEMFEQAGIDIYYAQPAVDVEVEETDGVKKMTAVIITTKSGLKRLRAKMFIDCSGDGDISAWGGADYECGSEDNGELQPGTLKLYYDSSSIPAAARKLEGNYIYHIKDFNGADSDSKTRAEIDARAQAVEFMNKLGQDSELSKLQVTGCAPEVAVRESRRIICDTYITMDDYVNARSYPDGICYSFYCIDLHLSHSDKNIFQIHLKEPRVPSIPLSAMTVKGFRNLYVAGRCVSGDRYANSAYRVKASCMAMGQAVGAAAAVSVKSADSDSRTADFNKIKEILKRNKAIIPE